MDDETFTILQYAGRATWHQKTEPMNTRPTAPLIIIDKGKCHGTDISGSTAALVDAGNPACGYYILDGPRAGWCINDDYTINEIAAWRECAAVPTGELVALRAAFMGVELSNFQYAVIQKLCAHPQRRWPMNPNDPLVPKIEFGERGDDNRVTATIDMVPLSSTYDVP